MSSLESQIPFTTSEESFLEGLEPVPTSEINFQNVFPSFSTTTTTASTTSTTPTTSTAAILMQFVNGSAFAESINGSQKIDLQVFIKLINYYRLHKNTNFPNSRLLVISLSWCHKIIVPVP